MQVSLASVNVQVQVTLRPKVSRSWSWCRAPFGAGDQLLHFFE
jgi:hypothetical protein